jgi:DNA-binding response OmpR family regulator
MALNLGAAYCLRKPFKPTELLAAIEHCLSEPASTLKHGIADRTAGSGRARQ